LADWDAEHVPPVTESAKGQNVVIGPNLDAARRSGNVSMDALSGDLTDFGHGDPQAAYGTPACTLMGEAVREALRTSLDLRDLQESIRQAHNGLRFMSTEESNALPDHGKGYSGNSATFKAARKAVLTAHVRLTREAGEALLPYGASADRWAMSASPDPLTYGSPVVTCWAYAERTFVVNTEGIVTDCLPLTTDGIGVADLSKPVTVAMHAQTRKDGAYVPEVIPVPWMTPRDALTRTDSAWIADQWTAYRPDVNTISADRFAAKRRPTSDESADPLPPVRKPTSRKRKRDGAMGGPAILSHR